MKLNTIEEYMIGEYILHMQIMMRIDH